VTARETGIVLEAVTAIEIGITTDTTEAEAAAGREIVTLTDMTAPAYLLHLFLLPRTWTMEE
jgi:hypothetical protein